MNHVYLFTTAWSEISILQSDAVLVTRRQHNQITFPSFDLKQDSKYLRRQSLVGLDHKYLFLARDGFLEKDEEPFGCGQHHCDCNLHFVEFKPSCRLP